MKTFRITYAQASENMVEIEAESAKDAWKHIINDDLDGKNVILNIYSVILDVFFCVNISQYRRYEAPCTQG